MFGPSICIIFNIFTFQVSEISETSEYFFFCLAMIAYSEMQRSAEGFAVNAWLGFRLL